MKISVYPYFLTFIHPFALAHGTRTGTQLVFVKIEYEGITSYGEASLPPYLKEDLVSVKKWIEHQKGKCEELFHINPFENIELIPFSKENTAASAALQTAIINWYSLANNKSLIDFFPQNNHQPDVTLTVTKDDFKYLNEKLIKGKDFTHFKLKLTGHDDDIEFVKAVRNKTEIPFCIDINQGYASKDKAIKIIEKLSHLNCVLIEQPLNANDHDGHYWLKQRTQLPIIADESIQTFEDLTQNYEAYSGVNIKLMKCGGLFQAQQMIDFCNSIPNYKKLIGCMSESTLGVYTAATLASQCDMADLDSPYLNNNDPFEGFSIQMGKIALDIAPILRKKSIFSELKSS